ncbi:MAG: hypothetical protein AB1445_15070 [Bacillota bacterium]
MAKWRVYEDLHRASLDVRPVPAGSPRSLVGDAGKLRTHTGWFPSIPLEKTLADILDYWREQVALPGSSPC